MASAIAKTTGAVLASVAILGAVATPASADDSGYFPGPKPCKSGARYAVGWNNNGHWLYGRDCKADGTSIRVTAYAWKGKDYVTLGSVWDHSSAGDGGWKNLAEIGPEGWSVHLYVEQHWANGNWAQLADIVRDYHT